MENSEWNANSTSVKLSNFVPFKAKVLDIGCGTGMLAKYLTEVKNCNVTGVECSDEYASKSRKWCSSIIIGDIEDKNILNRILQKFYDVILMADVIEHLRSPSKVLQEVSRFLKPNGFILISLPNIAHYSMRIRLLFGRFEYTSGGILDYSHLRFFTLRSISKLIKESGYKIEYFDTVSTFLDRLCKRRCYKMGRIMSKIFPTLFGYQFIFKIIPC